MNVIRHSLVSALATGSLLPALAAAAAPARESAGNVPRALTAQLVDQHGRTDSIAAHEGEPRVVFVVSAQRLRRLRDWEQELDRRLSGIRFLRVADVPSQSQEPPARYEDVAATLRKRVPEAVSVLIDTERRFARDFELDTLEVNLLLFDAKGGWIGHLRGRPTPENLERVTARLLAQGGVRRKDEAATTP